MPLQGGLAATLGLWEARGSDWWGNRNLLRCELQGFFSKCLCAF